MDVIVGTSTVLSVIIITPCMKNLPNTTSLLDHKSSGLNVSLTIYNNMIG